MRGLRLAPSPRRAMLALMASIIPPDPAKSRPHLAYIDGLRGLAALFVIVHHAMAECIDSGYNRAVTGRVPSHAIVWLYNGEVAVQVFIVLSGYCLMIPVARSGGTIRGGLAEFARRRVWRILPTYYAALAICLLLPALVPALRDSSGPLRWRVTRPVTAPALLSHLLMIHHLSADWAYRIDYPMWSIPIEWWLYGLFALALVPLRRRLGIGPLAASTVALGLALSWWGGPDFETLRLHYLALFGLGMAGAAINFGAREGGWSAGIGAGVGLLRLSPPLDRLRPPPPGRPERRVDPGPPPRDGRRPRIGRAARVGDGPQAGRSDFPPDPVPGASRDGLARPDQLLPLPDPRADARPRPPRGDPPRPRADPEPCRGDDRGRGGVAARGLGSLARRRAMGTRADGRRTKSN